MTNEHSDVQDERSQADIVESLSIADLRRFAKMMGITSQRDWTKEDYVAALKAKQNSNNTDVVFDSALEVKAGYARVLIHRDPTPGHANKPVHAGFNGLIFAIPRGVEVEVPKPVVESLANAVTVYTEQDQMPSRDNPGGTFKENARLSYPFQVLAMSPHEYTHEDFRSRSYAQRKAFFDRYGAWPTEAELKEAKKVQMNRDFGRD